MALLGAFAGAASFAGRELRFRRGISPEGPFLHGLV
jgi:hypothetical protein